MNFDLSVKWDKLLALGIILIGGTWLAGISGDFQQAYTLYYVIIGYLFGNGRMIVKKR